MTTLSIACPVHGVRGAHAQHVRIASREAADGTVQHALTAPCPEADCSIAVLVPPRAVTQSVVERLFAAGAQVVKVARHTAAAALVEFPVPHVPHQPAQQRPAATIHPTPGGVA